MGRQQLEGTGGRKALALSFFPVAHVAPDNHCVNHRNRQHQPRPLSLVREESISAEQNLPRASAWLGLEAQV